MLGAIKKVLQNRKQASTKTEKGFQVILSIESG